MRLIDADSVNIAASGICDTDGEPLVRLCDVHESLKDEEMNPTVFDSGKTEMGMDAIKVLEQLQGACICAGEEYTWFGGSTKDLMAIFCATATALAGHVKAGREEFIESLSRAWEFWESIEAKGNEG